MIFDVAIPKCRAPRNNKDGDVAVHSLGLAGFRVPGKGLQRDLEGVQEHLATVDLDWCGGE